MAHFQMKRRQRIESRALVPSLASNSLQFWFRSRRRTHLSRLSTAGHHGPRRQQTRQATQIDGEHSQREYVAHLGAAAQLDLANRTAVLLAVAKQRFDHLANDLTHRVASRSLVIICVSLMPFCALKSTSGLLRLPLLAGGGPSLGTNLLCEAHARIMVPSTLKCSSQSSCTSLACCITRSNSERTPSCSISRSRFLV